jgi:hypothetical protein
MTQGTSLAKRRVNDHAPIGGAGAPPSQRLNYFRIDLEMESAVSDFVYTNIRKWLAMAETF